MSVNISKTQVVHFRKKNEALTDFEFKLVDSILEICHKYKCIGVILNEILDSTETANILSESEVDLELTIDPEVTVIRSLCLYNTCMSWLYYIEFD